MTARIKGCCVCPPIEFDCGVCSDICKITFEWDAQGADLDTSVVYNGASSGFNCNNGNNPFFETGDDTGQEEREVHYVCLPKDTQSEIKIYCHWWALVPENKTVRVIIDKCSTIITRELSVANTDNSCSSNNEENFKFTQNI